MDTDEGSGAVLTSSNAGQLSTDTPPKQITFASSVGVKLGVALAGRRNADKPQRLKHAHRCPIEADPSSLLMHEWGEATRGCGIRGLRAWDFVNSSDPVLEARACNPHCLSSVNLQ